MAEDSWMRLERETFLTKYTRTKKLSTKDIPIAKEMLTKYNAHLVRALFGESPYVAQNLKESILKSQESEDNG